MPKKAVGAASSNFKWRLLTFTALLAATFAADLPANAAGYRYTQIDVPGADHTWAYDINDAGQIVGGFKDATGTHGFLDAGGHFTRLDNGEARGINNPGQIVVSNGLINLGGDFTPINVPGSLVTWVRGVNNTLQIVGSIYDGDGHGFIETGGKFTQIDVPGATNTDAYGINDAGQIVGGTTEGHGFIDTGGSFIQIDVPVPGGTYTIAGGINDKGQIVGSFYKSPSPFQFNHGFLYSNGSFTQVDVPGATLTHAWGINDAGEIVGYFGDSTGTTHGFLATPGGNASGDPWFTTFNGLRYQFQQPGEFVLSRSTVTGDPFEVEIRDRPWRVGAYGNIISAAAAELCGHRATFDVDRIGAGEGFVWVDGHPSLLSLGDPLLLGDGKLAELSASDYQLLWDTGEMVDVTIRGPELSVSSWYSPFLGPNSVEGLLTTSANPDQWRISDPISLFDDPPALLDAAAAAAVPEPATLTILAVVLATLAIIRRRALLPKPANGGRRRVRENDPDQCGFTRTEDSLI